MRWPSKNTKVECEKYLPWFAFYPVRVSTGYNMTYIWVWLETIGRRKYFWMCFSDGGWDCEYCLKEQIENKNRELGN